MGLLAWIIIGVLVSVVVVLGVGLFASGLVKGAQIVSQNPAVNNASTEAKSAVGNATQTPSIKALISEVRSVNLTSEVQTNLIAPLNQAQTILNEHIASSDQAACGKLGDFIIGVDSNLKDGNISAKTAATLDSMAQKSESDIGCK